MCILTGVKTFDDGRGVDVVPPAKHADQMWVELGDFDSRCSVHGRSEGRRGRRSCTVYIHGEPTAVDPCARPSSQPGSVLTVSTKPGRKDVAVVTLVPEARNPHLNPNPPVTPHTCMSRLSQASVSRTWTKPTHCHTASRIYTRPYTG